MKVETEIKQEPAIDTYLDHLEVVPVYAVNSVMQTTVDDLEQAEGILIKNEIDFCTTLKNHDAVDSRSIIFCVDCNFKTSSKLLLEHHSCSTTVKNVDITSRKQNFNCTECSYTTSSKSKLENHFHIQSRVKNVRVFRCKKCSFMTTINNSYKQHLVKHRNDESYTKLICKKNIISRLYLDSHNCNRFQYSCRKCTFVDDTYDVLMLHLIDNHKDIFFKCSICEKSFIELEDKEYHMRMHLSRRGKCNQTTKKVNNCEVETGSTEKNFKNKYILPRVEIPARDTLTNMTSIENCNIVHAAAASDVIKSSNIECLTVNINPLTTCNNVPVVANVAVNTLIGQDFIPSFVSNHSLNQNFVLVGSNIFTSATQPVIHFNNETNSVPLFQNNTNNVYGFANNYVLGFPQSVSILNNFVSEEFQLNQSSTANTPFGSFNIQNKNLICVDGPVLNNFVSEKFQLNQHSKANSYFGSFSVQNKNSICIDEPVLNNFVSEKSQLNQLSKANAPFVSFNVQNKNLSRVDGPVLNNFVSEKSLLNQHSKSNSPFRSFSVQNKNSICIDGPVLNNFVSEKSQVNQYSKANMPFNVQNKNLSRLDGPVLNNFVSKKPQLNQHSKANSPFRSFSVQNKNSISIDGPVLNNFVSEESQLNQSSKANNTPFRSFSVQNKNSICTDNNFESILKRRLLNPAERKTRYILPKPDDIVTYNCDF